MQDLRKLKVWEKSHNLTLEIYKSTESFPGIEIYGLTSQIRCPFFANSNGVGQ
jgi:hypothetical protein